MIETSFAEWSSELRWESLPPRVQATVVDIVLDAAASGLAGRTQALVAQITPVMRAVAGVDSPVARTFVDAYAITSATLCDVYRPALCHVTPVVIPPLVAIGEDRDTSGPEFLAAVAVGLETTVRLAQALDYPALRKRGWHSPGIVGTVGAAAAVARVLRLDPTRSRNAMAHGAAQAAGTFSSLGTEGVKFNQARGAVAGLLAGRMGEAGLASAANWLTHPDGGMAGTYADGGEPGALTKDLGEHWELANISLRRWPAASSVQSLIEVCLELDARRDNIQRVEVELGTDAFTVSGDRGWDVPLAAQQSARWVAAAVIHDRDWWLEQSAPDRITDPEVGAFAAERVHVTSVDDLGQAGVRVDVQLSDGSHVKLERDTAPGDPLRPLTAAQIDAKTERAAASCGLDSAAEVIDRCRSLPDAETVAPFLQLLRAAERAQ
jgi:2-methylcitrate dehydratase PrpD